MDKRHTNARDPAALPDAQIEDNGKATSIPDDLSALMSRASLEKSTYREFTVAPSARRTEQNSEKPKVENAKRLAVLAEPSTTGPLDAPARDSHPVPDETARASERTWDEPASGQAPFDPRQSSTTETDWSTAGESSNPTHLSESNARKRRRSVRSFGSPWPALDNLFSQDRQSFDLIQSIVATIHVPLVFVSSLNGGVGVTTISATLGRCLAGWGERIVVAETQASLVMPFFFSARANNEEEILHFDVPGSHQSIQVIRGVQNNKGPSNSQNAGAEVALLERLRESASVSDRVFLDASRHSIESVLATLGLVQTMVVPIVPDFCSALCVLDLEDRLRAEKSNGTDAILPHYLLNKFDSALALHRDLQILLKSRLGDRLLPLVIRRSDAVSEALAKGMTVVDYSPESGIAQDFLQLAEWVRSSTPEVSAETGKQ